MGNPFGLGGTVTAGIVSAVSRDIGSGPYDQFIQVDAPINQGNSGGPLFTQDGKVIGMNTAIFSPTGGSVGIGFAIPSDMIRTVSDQLVVERPRDPRLCRRRHPGGHRRDGEGAASAGDLGRACWRAWCPDRPPPKPGWSRAT